MDKDQLYQSFLSNGGNASYEEFVALQAQLGFTEDEEVKKKDLPEQNGNPNLTTGTPPSQTDLNPTMPNPIPENEFMVPMGSEQDLTSLSSGIAAETPSTDLPLTGAASSGTESSNPEITGIAQQPTYIKPSVGAMLYPIGNEETGQYNERVGQRNRTITAQIPSTTTTKPSIIKQQELINTLKQPDFTLTPEAEKNLDEILKISDDEIKESEDFIKKFTYGEYNEKPVVSKQPFDSWGVSSDDQSDDNLLALESKGLIQIHRDAEGAPVFQDNKYRYKIIDKTFYDNDYSTYIDNAQKEETKKWEEANIDTARTNLNTAKDRFAKGESRPDATPLQDRYNEYYRKTGEIFSQDNIDRLISEEGFAQVLSEGIAKKNVAENPNLDYNTEYQKALKAESPYSDEQLTLAGTNLLGEIIKGVALTKESHKTMLESTNRDFTDADDLSEEMAFFQKLQQNPDYAKQFAKYWYTGGGRDAFGASETRLKATFNSQEGRSELMDSFEAFRNVQSAANYEANKEIFNQTREEVKKARERKDTNAIVSGVDKLQAIQENIKKDKDYVTSFGTLSDERKSVQKIVQKKYLEQQQNEADYKEALFGTAKGNVAAIVNGVLDASKDLVLGIPRLLNNVTAQSDTANYILDEIGKPTQVFNVKTSSMLEKVTTYDLDGRQIEERNGFLFEKKNDKLSAVTLTAEQRSNLVKKDSRTDFSGKGFFGTISNQIITMAGAEFMGGKVLSLLSKARYGKAVASATEVYGANSAQVKNILAKQKLIANPSNNGVIGWTVATLENNYQDAVGRGLKGWEVVTSMATQSFITGIASKISPDVKFFREAKTLEEGLIQALRNGNSGLAKSLVNQFTNAIPKAMTREVAPEILQEYSERFGQTAGEIITSVATGKNGVTDFNLEEFRDIGLETAATVATLGLIGHARGGGKTFEFDGKNFDISGLNRTEQLSLLANIYNPQIFKDFKDNFGVTGNKLNEVENRVKEVKKYIDKIPDREKYSLDSMFKVGVILQQIEAERVKLNADDGTFADRINGKIATLTAEVNAILDNDLNPTDNAETHVDAKPSEEWLKEKDNYKPEDFGDFGAKGFKKGLDIPRPENDFRTEQDLIKEFGFDKKTTVNEFFFRLAESKHLSESEKTLVNKLKKYEWGDGEVKINNNTNALGYYRPSDNNVYFNLKKLAYDPQGGIDRVALHELMHYASYNGLRNNTEFKDGINDVFSAVKNQFESENGKKAEKFYGMMDTDELVSEAFSNPKFQEYLKTVKYKNTTESVWGKFIEYLNQLLGLSKNDTALSEVLALTSNYVDNNFNKKYAETTSTTPESETIQEQTQTGSNEPEQSPVQQTEPIAPIEPNGGAGSGVTELPQLSQTDNKGRVFKYRSNTKTKDGIITTKYEFNRSDKDSSQWNNSSIPINESGYEVIDEEGILNGTTDVRISELRTDENGNAEGTIKYRVDGNIIEGEFKLNQKPNKQTTAETQAPTEEPAQATQEVAPEGEINEDDIVLPDDTIDLINSLEDETTQSDNTGADGNAEPGTEIIQQSEPTGQENTQTVSPTADTGGSEGDAEVRKQYEDAVKEEKNYRTRIDGDYRPSEHNRLLSKVTALGYKLGNIEAEPVNSNPNVDLKGNPKEEWMFAYSDLPQWSENSLLEISAPTKDGIPRNEFDGGISGFEIKGSKFYGTVQDTPNNRSILQAVKGKVLKTKDSLNASNKKAWAKEIERNINNIKTAVSDGRLSAKDANKILTEAELQTIQSVQATTPFSDNEQTNLGGDIQSVKGKYIKDGFEIEYEKPDYVELFKKITDSTDVGEYETKKIGEKITISLNEDGSVEVLSADYNINGGGLSGQAGKRKFYDLGKYKPIENPNQQTGGEIQTLNENQYERQGKVYTQTESGDFTVADKNGKQRKVTTQAAVAELNQMANERDEANIETRETVNHNGVDYDYRIYKDGTVKIINLAKQKPIKLFSETKQLMKGGKDKGKYKTVVRKSPLYSAIDAKVNGEKTGNQAKQEEDAIVKQYLDDTEMSPDPQTIAKRYFLNGGGISPDVIKGETGEDAKNVRWIHQFKDAKKLRTFKQAAESVSEEFDGAVDDNDVRNALIDVAMSYNNLADLRQEIISSYTQQQNFGYTEEQMAEIAQYEADVLQSEKDQALFDSIQAEEVLTPAEWTQIFTENQETKTYLEQQYYGQQNTTEGTAGTDVANGSQELSEQTQRLPDGERTNSQSKEEVKIKQKSILNSDRDLLGDYKEEAMFLIEYDNELNVGDNLRIKGINAPDYEAQFRGYNRDGNIVVFNKKTGDQATIKRNSRIENLSENKILSGSLANIEYAIENDLYKEWINEGRISKDDVVKLIKSAKLPLPEFLNTKSNATSPEYQQLLKDREAQEARVKSLKENLDRVSRSTTKDFQADQEDLFGERPAAEGMFDERADGDAGRNIISKAKADYDAARAELTRINNTIRDFDSGNANGTGAIDFQSTDKTFTSIPQTTYDKLVKRLLGVFKKFGGKVITTKAEVDAKLKEFGVGEDMKTKYGEIYGAKFPDGTIYLNPEKVNANTPIHEFSHLWQQLIPARFKKGVELLKNTPIGKKTFAELKANEGYANKSDEELWNEAMVTVMGNEGERIFNAPRASKLKEWLTDLFKALGNAFGIRDLSPNDKLSTFVKGALSEVMGAKEIIPESSVEQKEVPIYIKKMSNVDLRNMLERLGLVIDAVCP